MDRENFRYYCNEDFFQVYDQKVIDVFSGESSNNLQHIYNIPRRTLAAHQSRRGVTEAQKQRIQQVTDAFYESLDTSCFPRTDGELRELNFERRSECLIAYQEKFRTYNNSIKETLGLSNASYSICFEIMAEDDFLSSMTPKLAEFNRNQELNILKRQQLLKKSLSEITNNRAVGIGMCYHFFEGMEKDGSSIATEGMEGCGGHAVTAIGYKCDTSNNLLILIQNSSGINFCRSRGGSIHGIPCEGGKFWVTARNLSRSMLNTTTYGRKE